jgi:hypothetical protein
VIITKNIAAGLTPLQAVATGIPTLDFFLAEVDVALEEVLLSVNLAVAGILTVVTAV